MTTTKKSLAQILQEAYPKARPYIAILLVIAISIAPAIKNDNYRIGAIAALAVTLLFLLFDLFKNINTRLDQINANISMRLDQINAKIKGIDDKLREEEPPTYENFTSALPIIKGILKERLTQDRDVVIRILGVSAQFSWKNLIETALPELLNVGYKNPKICVEILIIRPEVLRNWGQADIERESSNTIERLSFFRKANRAAFEEGRIEVGMWLYDNIPHWHGVLIDDDTLFMGRCKWKVTSGRYYLQVGQKEYRQFSKFDRFKGDVRIELFQQWFETYKFRSTKIFAGINPQ